MEEELGLSMYHVNHPLLVGTWNFLAAAASGLALAIPVACASASFAHLWMPCAGAVGLASASFVSARATGRSMMEFFVVGVLTAVVTGGVVYSLAQWLVGSATTAS